MHISRHSPVPLHAQLQQLLRQEIQAGRWQSGEAIPTEHQLSETYGLSRTTVRQAISALEHEGWLSRQQGKGTFVSRPKIEEALGPLTGHAEELQQRGLAPTVRVLKISEAEADAEVASALQRPVGTPITCVQRVLEVEGEPLFWDRSCLPADLRLRLVPDLLEREPIVTLLERAGYAVRDADQRIGAQAASAAEAAALNVKKGSPLLRVERVVYGEHGPLDFSVAVYRHDRYQYHVRLRR